jgi:hypothetical protein
MPISNSGTFSFVIKGSDLAKGLRPSKRSPRNSKYLTECVGAIGLDNILHTIEDISGDRLSLNSVFPFPQLFVLTNLIIVCTGTKIYELVNGSLVLRLTVAAGTTWSLIESGDYIYMSNSVVNVVRNAISKVWALDTSLPTAGAMVNYNSQVMIASPDIDQQWDYDIRTGPITLTLSVEGSND